MLWMQRLAWIDLLASVAGLWAVWSTRSPSVLYLIPAQLALSGAVRRGLIMIGERRGWH